jgi:aspartate racemase
MKQIQDMDSRQRLAIIGGMGPLASTEFLRTIYLRSLNGGDEQELANILLFSDPTIPDRTASFASGRIDLVTERIDSLLFEARSLGAEQAVICCFTAHHIIPFLDKGNQDILVSLIDIALQSVIDSGKRFLLAATEGSLEMQVFQSSDYWRRAQSQVVIPEGEMRTSIHDTIYQIKRNGYSPAIARRMALILKDAGLDGLVCGCTELHLLARSCPPNEFSYIDPLLSIADVFAMRQTEFEISC